MTPGPERVGTGNTGNFKGSGDAGGVPARALVLSLLAFAAPVYASLAAPTWLDRDGALLVWVPLLLPAFLLAYYRGWRGASVALAGGMAALATTQAGILALDLGSPRWEATLATVVLLLVVAVSAGWMGETLHRTRAVAEKTALTDSLTGLPNRRHATVFLEAAWGQALRGREVAVVLFDLDHFKRINDLHGHAAGDETLRTFAAILENRTRRMDLSARFGGEEFISILVDCPLSEAVGFADEVRATLAGTELPWGPVTLSAGVAANEEDMGAPDVLVAAADRALYVAKDRGRDQVCRSDEPLGRTRRSSASRTVGGIRGSLMLEGLEVLLVDDDPDTLRSTARLLESLGCRVRAQQSPRHALDDLLSDAPLDVLVTDIVMPEMGGFSLVELAERVRDIPLVLYISGYPQEDVYWGGTPGTRHRFLGKPIERDDLHAALLNLLDEEVSAVTGRPDGAPEPGAHAAEAGPGRAGARQTVSGGSTGHAAARAASDDGAALRGRILVVDDEADVAQALQRVFRRVGYATPLVETDPARALDRVREEGVDIVLLDLHMPGMSGLEVLRDLNRATGPEDLLPVLVLTGDDDPDLRRRALAAGALDFLSKPLDVAEAEARVSNLLSIRWLHQRVAEQRDALEERVQERTSELADARTEILHRLARAAEYRDDVTGRHAERVGLMASLIAAELDAGARTVELIRRTAPLHDVGKIAVPDAILRKPGRLTRSEFEIMKTHTVVGEQILGGSRQPLLCMAARIAAGHHEKWDGSGYPRGLAGAGIPFEARIVTVADVFDSLSHARPYKQACAASEAVDIIRTDRGTHFDPDAVDAFMAICERVGPDGLHRLADPVEPLRDTAQTLQPR
ncbi:MAG: diguanylate cyclase [Longimicrobiales bacterium]